MRKVRKVRSGPARLARLDVAQLEAAVGGESCAEMRVIHDATEAKERAAFLAQSEPKLRWEKIPFWNIPEMIRQWNDVPNARKAWEEASRQNGEAFGKRTAACIRGVK